MREAELLTLQHGAFGIRRYIFIGAKHDAAAHFTVPGDVPAATAATVAISMGQQKNGTAECAPLALRENFKFNRVLFHERLMVESVIDSASFPCAAR